MTVLLDANILLRMAEPGSPSYPVALGATSMLIARNEVLCVVPQVLYEFWVVATRPVAVNGLGMACPQAAAEMARLTRIFPLMPDKPAVYMEWERIVVTHQVAGKNAHDARLVAAMSAHGISHIMTFNIQDFTRYPGVTIIHPAAVASVP